MKKIFASALFWVFFAGNANVFAVDHSVETT